jgi:formylmethanofuran dehydrogenase subunit A
MRLKIADGRLYDPVSGWHGETRDLFIDGDRLAARLTTVDRTIDARGRSVLAGGIDLRGQAATCGVHLLHLWNGRPTLPELGLAYAALGYTHIHEPFLTPVTAGLVHRQLAALPVVDASASLVLNLRDLDVWLKDRDRWPEIGETISFLLEQTRALEVRLVEPFVRYRQKYYAHRTIKTEAALEILTGLALTDKLKLTLEATPEVLHTPFLEPRAFHLAGLGQALFDEESLESALGHLEAGLSADCGLAFPDPDAGSPPLRVDLGWHQPLNLRPAFPASQAKRALALALRYQGPQLAFSALGPARAPDQHHPRMLAWLLSRAARQVDWGEEVLPREWSLSEWAWATRALPAKVLGLEDRGHLKPGARADVALYDIPEQASDQALLSSLGRVHTLIKAGEVVIDNFQLVKPQVARAVYFRRTGAQATALLADICQYRSFRAEHLWVENDLGGPWVGLG